MIMLPTLRILLLPDAVEVEQTSHHASLYYYRQHHPAKEARLHARCKRCSGVTSQRDLPREPVHIHVHIHGCCCCVEDVRALLVACAACVEPVFHNAEARFGQRQMDTPCWQPRNTDHAGYQIGLGKYAMPWWFV